MKRKNKTKLLISQRSKPKKKKKKQQLKRGTGCSSMLFHRTQVQSLAHNCSRESNALFYRVSLVYIAKFQDSQGYTEKLCL